jgi:uncharacterized protein (TIGR03083 family)
MEVSEFLAALNEQGQLMAAAAAGVEPTAPVPTCPDWQVRDLLLHTGGVHRWAATIVGEARAAPVGVGRPQDIVAELPSDAELVDWFRDGHAALVRTLETAAPELRCWTFQPAPSPLAFWARRQTHETAIHRIDAEAAAGALTPVNAEVAADGVDELLTGFLSYNRRLRRDTERTLGVHATDTGRHWLVRIGPNAPRTERATGPLAAEATEATVSGTAEALYLALWNRQPLSTVVVTGDESLLSDWTQAVRVRWSL